MGMSYSAKLIVGLHRDEIENEDVIDELDSAPPYYDGGDEAIIGVCVEETSSYSAKEVAITQAKIDAAHAEFREITGQEGKLYLTPCGY